MEIAIIRLKKNLKYLFIVEQLRGIRGNHSNDTWTSGDFRQLSSLLVSPLKNEKYRIISTNKLISY
jgi:hypothetical protein